MDELYNLFFLWEDKEGIKGNSPQITVTMSAMNLPTNDESK